jgi:NADH-quinone oxidoreductase subunit G
MLAGVLKSVLQNAQVEIPDYLVDIEINDVATQLAEKLFQSDNSVIVLGEHIVNNPQAASIANLVSKIAQHTNSTTLNVSATANSMAANMTGFVPGKGGLDVNTMLAADLKAYILLDVYPQYDFHHSLQAVEALSNEDTFVISLNSFKDDAVAQYSDVLLPIASFYETSGSHVNVEGEVQSFAAAVNAPSDTKPAWKVLKVLADLLELPGFHYADSAQVTSEVMHQSHKQHAHNESIDVKVKRGINVIWQKSPYAVDVLSRHATSLQATNIGQINSASMNKATAKKLEVAPGDEYLGVPVAINEAVANNCVFVNANHSTGVQS